MNKIIINILLVMSMIFNCTTSAIAVTEKELEKSQATQVLLMLDIIKGYEDNTLKLDKYITRAEMATLIVRVKGLEKQMKDGGFDLKTVRSKLFNDVSIEHWANPYINLANGMYVIKGVDNNKFNPDDNITYQDLVTMIVRALGYELEMKFEKISGYPEKHLSVAKDIGLLKGINLEQDDFVKRRDAIQLIFNSLTIDNMERLCGVYGENERSFSVAEGSNFLKRFDIDRNYGKIDRVKDDEVYINDTKYKIGPTNAAKYIGLEVSFYYVKNEKGEKILIILEKKT